MEAGNIPFRVFVWSSLGGVCCGEEESAIPLPFIGAREHGELAGRARKARLESLVFHEHLSE